MAIPDHAAHIIISGVAATTEDWSFGWWEDTTLSNTDLALDPNSEWTAFRTELLACMSADQVITDYDLYVYMGGVPASHDHVSVSHAGTSAGSPLPLQLSTVLTLRTATLTRSGRGRIYLPTNGEAILAGTGHIWGSGHVDNLVDKLAAFFAYRQTTNIQPCVMSRTSSAMHTITSVDADYVPDTQRRRTRQMSTSRHSALV